MKLRLPDALVAEHGEHLILEGLYFSYGHAALVEALDSCKTRERLKREKNPSYALYGKAISYRFKRADKDGWYVCMPVSLFLLRLVVQI